MDGDGDAPDLGGEGRIANKGVLQPRWTGLPPPAELGRVRRQNLRPVPPLSHTHTDEPYEPQNVDHEQNCARYYPYLIHAQPPI